MSLPTTGISTTLVNNTIGAGSHDVRELCTFINVKSYSRHRPGYYYIDEFNSISYRVPRGGSVADPRGGVESFKLGDFRKYNHSALAYKLISSFPDIRLNNGASYTIPVSFFTGEVDWMNKDEDENAHNYLGNPTHFWIRIIHGDFDHSIGTYKVAIPSTINSTLNLNVPVNLEDNTGYRCFAKIYIGNSSSHSCLLLSSMLFHIENGTLPINTELTVTSSEVASGEPGIYSVNITLEHNNEIPVSRLVLLRWKMGSSSTWENLFNETVSFSTSGFVLSKPVYLHAPSGVVLQLFNFELYIDGVLRENTGITIRGNIQS